jgi:ABC-2 type transport system permease protein
MLTFHYIKIPSTNNHSPPSPLSMNPALWRKAFSDSWLQLLISSLILIVFAWIFLWLSSQIDFSLIAKMLKALPPFFRKVSDIPPGDLVTPLGRSSFLFIHIVTLLICVGWSVGRGSDPVSGEIGRGTMDLLASLPIYRSSLLFPPAVVAALGAAALAMAVWLGIAIGLTTLKIEGVGLLKYLPGVVNLFSMMFCLTGVTTFVSTWARDRWRTIFIIVGFYVVSSILQLVSRLWEKGWWLSYCSFLSCFHPQEFILLPEKAGWPMIRANSALLAIGLLCYFAAAINFWRKDVPMSR